MTVLFVVFAAAVLAIGGYLIWSKQVRSELAEGAVFAFDRFQREEPDLLAGISADEFGEMYTRANFPRFPKYLLVTAFGFIAAFPGVLIFLSALLWGLDTMGLIAEPAELAKYVPLGEGKTDAGREQREEMALYLAKDYGGFYYFFGIVGCWIALLLVSMRTYHKRRPEPVRDQLIRRREALSGA